jgi:hypothetical protein
MCHELICSQSKGKSTSGVTGGTGNHLLAQDAGQAWTDLSVDAACAFYIQVVLPIVRFGFLNTWAASALHRMSGFRLGCDQSP